MASGNTTKRDEKNEKEEMTGRGTKKGGGHQPPKSGRTEKNALAALCSPDMQAFSQYKGLFSFPFKHDRSTLPTISLPPPIKLSINRMDNKIGWLLEGLVWRLIEPARCLGRHPDKVASCGHNSTICIIRLGYSSERLSGSLSIWVRISAKISIIFRSVSARYLHYRGV